MEKTKIELLGYVFDEPQALLSNWLLAILCLVFYYITSKKKTTLSNYWSLFFLVLSVSCVIGGLGHFLFRYSGMWLKYPTWILSVLALAMIENGASTLSKYENRIRIIISIKFLLGVVGIIVFKNFLIVGVSFALGFLGIILLTFLMNGHKDRARTFVWAIVFYMLAGVAFGLKYDINIWFNHMELGHTFLACALFFVYRTGMVKKTIEE